MKYLFLFLLVLGIKPVCAQHQMVYKSNSSTNVTTLPKYDAITGKKLSLKEFVEMTQKYPGIVPFRKINKYGEISALYFDARKSGRVSYRDTSLRVKPGEEFLPFVMRTIDGECLDSEKLKGKKILLHSQLLMQAQRFVESSFQEVTALVKEKQKAEDVVFIVMTVNAPNEIDDSILAKNELAKIVPNAGNFSERLIINSYPSNILIDEEGKLIGYYEPHEFEKLKADWK